MGGDALDDLHYLLRAIHWHTLHQKMYMVFISANFNEWYFIAFADFQTRLFELLVNFFCKDHSPVLGRADDMVQKQRDIVTLMDILAHPSSISQQAAGNITR